MNTSKLFSSPVAHWPRTPLLDHENEGRGRVGLRAHPRSLPSAFTLIELLVVIGIIAILAAMLFPAGIAIRNKATLKRVQGELSQMETAIESYKIEKGFYPPDNKTGNNPVTVRPEQNVLYYELTGATIDGARTGFLPSDGGPVVSRVELGAAFGVSGINNAGIEGNTGELVAKNYLPDLKPTQFGPGVGGPRILGTIVDGPLTVGDINPFRYVSSNPTNNPSSFDLWVDIEVSGKTNRISNWRDEPEIVSY
jgi:prepilin-type N-terminal cleavage/methylation domain-containing protein